MQVKISISKNHIVRINGNVIILDGSEIPPPPHFTEHNSNITAIGDHIYINGYEWRNNNWKRTLAALWHYIF